jgi:hypothetical protein
MSFPQTLPSTQVIAGKPFWRLFTPLESSGDIYEADTSGLAFVLGPQSDLDRVGITYYDDAVPGKASTVIISKDKPMVGRLDAFSTLKYGTGQKGRILISPSNLVAQTGVYEPNGFVEGDDLVIEPTLIDVLQFFSQAPDIIPPRNDRVSFYQAQPQVPGGSWYYMPYYGRRYASLVIANTGTAGAFDYEIFGVMLNTGGGIAPLFTASSQQISLRGPTTILAQALADEVIVPADGMFDALLVQISDNAGAAPLNMKTIMSDVGA